MPATRVLVPLLVLATLLLPGISSAADEATVELTAPFAADATSSSCTVAGVCLAQPSADKATGEIDANVTTAGVFAAPVVSPDARAAGTITATHAIPEGVHSISYQVWLRIDRNLISAGPSTGYVRLSASAAHSGGISLEGAQTASTPFIGGVLLHEGDQLTCLRFTVSAAAGQSLPAGDVRVDVTASSSIDGPSVAGAGAAAGTITSGFTLQRVVATWS